MWRLAEGLSVWVGYKTKRTLKIKCKVLQGNGRLNNYVLLHAPLRGS